MYTLLGYFNYAAMTLSCIPCLVETAVTRNYFIVTVADVTKIYKLFFRTIYEDNNQPITIMNHAHSKNLKNNTKLIMLS